MAVRLEFSLWLPLEPTQIRAHAHLASSLEIAPELLRKYDRPGPRYTSYPTAPQWRDDFGADAYRAALVRGAASQDERFALYVHIPFCEERCHYCGCNVVISKKPAIAEGFLDQVDLELSHVTEVLGNRRELVQLHWGGGTPTYLTVDQIARLYACIAERLDIDATTEVALEVDPRVTTREQIGCLHALGFNRISMGVQDLDPDVQRAIGRNQSVEQTRSLYDHCRALGFTGINFDLIYGLPSQSIAGWERTVSTVIEMAPDRLAIYSYAHLPERLKHQAKMDANALPDAQAKSALINLARRMLVDAGYRAIGMDHFARPDDELALAAQDGRLHRNFMGYTTIADTQMIGVGPSAISFVGNAYAQNEKRLAKHYRALEAAGFSTAAGIALSEDDLIRRWAIESIMCNGRVSYDAFADRHGVAFDRYFVDEAPALAALVADGIIEIDGESLIVCTAGRLFIRNVAMVFDAYLQRPNQDVQYSRTV